MEQTFTSENILKTSNFCVGNQGRNSLIWLKLQSVALETNYRLSFISLTIMKRRYCNDIFNRFPLLSFKHDILHANNTELDTI